MLLNWALMPLPTWSSHSTQLTPAETATVFVLDPLERVT